MAMGRLYRDHMKSGSGQRQGTGQRGSKPWLEIGEKWSCSMGISTGSCALHQDISYMY